MRYRTLREYEPVAERPDGDWRDQFNDHPDFRNIGIHLDGRLAGGVRINRITPQHRNSAVLSAYPGYIEDMLARGFTFVEASRLFTAPETAPPDRLLPFAIIRLVGIAARHHGDTHVVKNVHVKHTAFYRRHLLAQVVPGSRKPYKDATRPVDLVLLTAEVAPSYPAMLGHLPYLLSTQAEMDGLFSAQPSPGHVSPGVLAVLDRASPRS